MSFKTHNDSVSKEKNYYLKLKSAKNKHQITTMSFFLNLYGITFLYNQSSVQGVCTLEIIE